MNFSREELWDLGKAWVLVTIAFHLVFRFPINPVSFLLTGVVVGGAVILHEIGHKYVAERYGYQASFVSNDLMLVLGVFMAVTGFIFIAPGAVHVRGLRDKQRNAIIAWAGPAVNALLALIAYLLVGVGTASSYFALVLRVNAILGAFNLIPVGGFDGQKIWAGDRRLYIGSVIVLGMLVGAAFSL